MKNVNKFMYFNFATRMQVTATATKKAQPIRAEQPNLGDDYP